MQKEKHSSITTLPLPPVNDVIHRFVTVGTNKVHVAECGQGKPVLLIHSFPQHWYEWRGVLPLLKDSYHLIAIDMPGFGWSDASTRGYSTTARAKDVLEIMDALGIQSVDLIGHGWGAIVGYELCLIEPSRFEHFLAIGATHPWISRKAAIRNAWRQWHTAFWEYPLIGRQVLLKFPSFTRFILRHWSARKDDDKQQAFALYAASYRKSSHAIAGEKLNWEYVLHDIPKLILRSARRQHLHVPTLMLEGAKDVLIPPAMCKGGEAHADSLQLVIMQDTGQLLPEEIPDAVATAARRLFD